MAIGQHLSPSESMAVEQVRPEMVNTFRDNESSDSYYVHTMPAHSENGENMTVGKFEPAFTRCQNSLKTIQNLTVKIARFSESLPDFDAREIPTSEESVSFPKASKNALVFIIFKHSHIDVSKMCRLEFCFQI